MFHLFVTQGDVAKKCEISDVGYLKKGVPLETIFSELVLQLFNFFAHAVHENLDVPPLGGGLMRVYE